MAESLRHSRDWQPFAIPGQLFIQLGLSLVCFFTHALSQAYKLYFPAGLKWKVYLDKGGSSLLKQTLFLVWGKESKSLLCFLLLLINVLFVKEYTLSQRKWKSEAHNFLKARHPHNLSLLAFMKYRSEDASLKCLGLIFLKVRVLEEFWDDIFDPPNVKSQSKMVEKRNGRLSLNGKYTAYSTIPTADDLLKYPWIWNWIYLS